MILCKLYLMRTNKRILKPIEKYVLEKQEYEYSIKIMITRKSHNEFLLHLVCFCQNITNPITEVIEKNGILKFSYTCFFYIWGFYCRGQSSELP